MIKGAHYVHQQLKDELVHYLQSQYLGQSEVLLNACNDQMQQPGNLWSHPYIESSPAYESIPHGIETANIPQEKDVIHSVQKKVCSRRKSNRTGQQSEHHKGNPILPVPDRKLDDRENCEQSNRQSNNRRGNRRDERSQG